MQSIACKWHNQRCHVVDINMQENKAILVTTASFLEEVNIDDVTVFGGVPLRQMIALSGENDEFI